MRRLLALLVSAAVPVACATLAPSAALPPAALVSSVQPFVVGGARVCTAFSINETLGLWLTANHCWQDAALGVATVAARVERYDEELDLLLLRSQLRAPALQPGRAARVRDEIEVVGLPGAYDEAVRLFGRISVARVSIAPGHGDISGEVMLGTACGAEGMSGAPVLIEGRVSGMMRGGTHQPCLDMLAPLDHLRRFLGLQWEEPLQ